MGRVPPEPAVELRDELSLARAVETGTYSGEGARLLARIFDSVVTIELSPDLWERARRFQADVANLELREGDSREELPQVVDPAVPTLYFLDGHWSGGRTAGQGGECPVLAEVGAVAAGHADDCLFIDDAWLFAALPPQPHDSAQWPTLIEVFDAVPATPPDHHVTLLDDLVIAVPQRAKPAVDRFGRRVGQPPQSSFAGRAATALARALRRLRPGRRRP